MVQDTSLCTLPFVDAEDDENDKTSDKRDQNTSIGPAEQVTTQIEPRQEQRQARSEKTASGEIEFAELLQEREVIETGVPLGRPVTEENADCSCCPESHLDPLKDRSADTSRSEEGWGRCT